MVIVELDEGESQRAKLDSKIDDASLPYPLRRPSPPLNMASDRTFEDLVRLRPGIEALSKLPTTPETHRAIIDALQISESSLSLSKPAANHSRRRTPTGRPRTRALGTHPRQKITRLDSPRSHATSRRHL